MLFLLKMNLHFLNGKNVNVWMIEKIKNELSTLSGGQNVDKILNKKINICATFRMKNGLNRMHPFIVS